MADYQLGVGYCHAAPRLACISRRWETIWRPLCALYAHRDGELDPTSAFAALRDAYHRRIDRLLVSRITWKAIHANNLDDPRRSGTEFDRALCLAIERKRCRMGRVPGKGKKYAPRKRDRSQQTDQRPGA
jgi:hypothetical protein